MKPMPYTPYAKCDCGDKWLGVHYARPDNHEWDYYSLNELPDLSLSDAECAAEYWRARLEAVRVIAAWHDSGGGIDETEDAVLADHEIDTWHRFATTPHAFRSRV